jgi:hypothetical protein
MAPNFSLSALDNQFIMTSTFININKVSSVREEDSWSWTRDLVTINSWNEGRSLQIQSNRRDIATWTFDSNEPALEQSQHWRPAYLRSYVKEALTIVPRGGEMHNKLIRIEEKLREDQGKLTHGSSTCSTDKDQQPMLGGASSQQPTDLTDRSPLSVQKQEDVSPNDREGESLEGVGAGEI